MKDDILVIALAARDPRTPVSLKLVCALLAAYAFSPIDLIPDFIPVLGLLDDLVILPLGIWFVLRWMPPGLLSELRAEAVNLKPGRSRVAAIVIVVIWIALGIGAYLLLRNAA